MPAQLLWYSSYRMSHFFSLEGQNSKFSHWYVSARAYRVSCARLVGSVAHRSIGSSASACLQLHHGGPFPSHLNRDNDENLAVRGKEDDAIIVYQEGEAR